MMAENHQVWWTNLNERISMMDSVLHWHLSRLITDGFLWFPMEVYSEGYYFYPSSYFWIRDFRETLWHQNDRNIKVHRILYVESDWCLKWINSCLSSFTMKMKLENTLKSNFEIFITIEIRILCFFDRQYTYYRYSNQTLWTCYWAAQFTRWRILFSPRYWVRNPFDLFWFSIVVLPTDVVLDWVEKY